MSHHCESGKVGHSSINRLKAAAHETHRHRNAEGQYARTSYGYRCPDCKRYHLTSRAEWYGVPNMLILEAAPLDLQEWAITGVRPVVSHGGTETD